MEVCEVSYSYTFRIYYVAVTVGSNHDAYIYICLLRSFSLYYSSIRRQLE